jgi:hypothetical protein
MQNRGESKAGVVAKNYGSWAGSGNFIRGNAWTKLREDFPARVFPPGGEDEAGLAAVDRTELAMDGPPVTLERAGRNSQLIGNQFVRRAQAGGLQDFLLPL